MKNEKSVVIYNVDELSELGKDIGSKLIEAICAGDPESLIMLGKVMLSAPVAYKNLVLYENYERYLRGVAYNEEQKRKFLSFLNTGDARTKAKRILMMLGNIDFDYKVESLINLTKSVGYKFISERTFFRYFKLIETTLAEDLLYLKDNLCHGEVEWSESVEELVRIGLMYETDNGKKYAFEDEAFIIDKYALSYGDEKYKYNGDTDFTHRINKPNKPSYLYAGVMTDMEEL